MGSSLQLSLGSWTITSNNCLGPDWVRLILFYVDDIIKVKICYLQNGRQYAVIKKLPD